MTREEFQENILERRIELIRSVLDTKNKEYAEKSDVFKSFKLGCDFSLHTTPSAVAWEFMVKHLQSIHQIISIYEKEKILPNEELLEEKIGDAINYLILIEGMLKEISYSRKQNECKIKYTLI